MLTVKTQKSQVSGRVVVTFLPSLVQQEVESLQAKIDRSKSTCDLISDAKIVGCTGGSCEGGCAASSTNR